VPEDALRELARRYTHFLCQLMRLGTEDEVVLARKILGDDAFRAALDAAPPGSLDDRSWSYWHLVLFKRHPAPPQPTRSFSP